jgi:hypothetical protein
MLCDTFYPIRKGRQIHIQILTIIDGNSTVDDFLDSSFTGTTLDFKLKEGDV